MINNRPPTGVIMPSFAMPVNAIVYSDPLKTKMPNIKQAPAVLIHMQALREVGKFAATIEKIPHSAMAKAWFV